MERVGQSWLEIFAESILIGSWFTLVPALILLLVSALTSYHVASLRRAWLGTLLLGLAALAVSATGWRPGLAGWQLGPFDRVPGGLGWSLLAIYLAGVLIILLRAVLGLWAIRRWTARARPVTDAGIVAAFEVAQAAHGVERPCYLLAGKHVPAPISVGWFNHRILLPSGLIADLDESEIRDLALHEMAHIKNRDPMAYGLAVFASALFWPNPFVWLAVHQLKLNAEKLADEAVIEVTEEVRPYSRLLLKMADLTAPRVTVPLAAGVNLHQSFFQQRAEALAAGMLTGGQPVGSAIPVWASLIFGAGVALACAPNFEMAKLGTVAEAPAIASDPSPSARLLRDGLFSEEAWTLYAGPIVSNVMVDARWLAALGLAEMPRYHGFRHLYFENGGKVSAFAFITAAGERLYLALNRGRSSEAAGQEGQWLLGREVFEPASMEPLAPGSAREEAAVALLKSWPLAALGDEREWQSLLRAWPKTEPTGKEHAALMIGESLETFRDLRLDSE